LPIHPRKETDILNRKECVQKACPLGGGESVQQGPLACYVLEGVSFMLAASRRGQPLFDARSVLTVREHGTMARTPLAAFFNIPQLISSASSSRMGRIKYFMIRFIILMHISGFSPLFLKKEPMGTEKRQRRRMAELMS